MNLWRGLIKILKSLGWTNIFKISALCCFILLVVGLLVVVFIPDSPVESALFDFLEWLDDLPVYYSSVLMLLAQTAGIILMLPGTPFNLACGFIFELWIGALVSVASADIAAIFSFLVVRYLARDWAARYIENRPKFKAIDKAVALHGMWLIVLIRISPILPFGLCNYMLGLMNIPFWKYWLASTVGLIPYTVAYTYLGSLLRGLADVFDEGSDSVESIILLSVGGGVTIVTIVAVAIVTKRALGKVVVEDDLPPDACTVEEGGVVVVDDEAYTTGESEDAPPVDGHVVRKETEKLEVGDSPRSLIEEQKHLKETTPLVKKKNRI